VKHKLSRSLCVQVAAENMQQIKDEVKQTSVKVVNVSICGAATHTAYLLISHIATGDVFGHDVSVSLRLCDTNITLLRATAMEIDDLASGFITSVIVTTDPAESFANCDLVRLSLSLIWKRALIG
jgi:L-alanine-DL-glutamate epimerase-like enolase superfamily enzyme